MTRFRSAIRLLRWRLRSRRVRWSIGAACLSAIVVVVAMLGVATRSEAQPKVYARLWPSFTMVYTIRDVDPFSGEVLTDQTWRLVVQDEYAWRQELIRDSRFPAEVGSYAEWKSGVYTYYSKEKNFTRTIGEPATRSTATITEELNPRLLVDIQAGADTARGWRDVAAQATGRLAKARTASVPSGQVPTRTIEERIEWAADSLRAPFVGGIAVLGERRINGVLTHSFTVDSLVIN